MGTQKKKSKKSGYKRTLMEYGGIAAVFAILYFTGLHTEVQRAMLWTGLFDAEAREITTTDGPILAENTYDMPLATPQGDEVRLAEFKGNVLFVNVWASWCPPCTEPNVFFKEQLDKLEGEDLLMPGEGEDRNMASPLYRCERTSESGIYINQF